MDLQAVVVAVVSAAAVVVQEVDLAVIQEVDLAAVQGADLAAVQEVVHEEVSVVAPEVVSVADSKFLDKYIKGFAFPFLVDFLSFVFQKLFIYILIWCIPYHIS